MTGNQSDVVRALAEPLARDLDVDLLDVQVKGSGPRQMVRVIVDRRGGVDLQTCQQLSKRLSVRLDETDPIADRYALEVTSPGIDYPLVGPRDFERVEGRDVLIHRGGGDGAVQQVRGRVAGSDGAAVVVDTDTEQVRVPYDEIVKATQCLPW